MNPLTLSDSIRTWPAEQRAAQVPYLERIFAKAKKLGYPLSESLIQRKSAAELSCLATELEIRSGTAPAQGYYSPEGGHAGATAKDTYDTLVREGDAHTSELQHTLSIVFEVQEAAAPAEGQQSGEPADHDEGADWIDG